ncbi:MAG: phage major capsid protein [Rhodospirillales bacterium]|nr:phage major capsid protein [Rhodospirillales bacterium]
MRTIKTGTLYRGVQIAREAIDADARTVELSFSSESPMERWFGTEILDHSPASVRLGRLKSGGPLLVDHDLREHVGVIESVSIDADRKGRALVRFGRAARAEEIWQDVQDGIRTSVSVGYRIHELKLDSEKDGEETYRAVDWEPLEVSLVSVPADVSVGVGRGEPGGEYEIRVVDDRPLNKEETMEPNTNTPAAPAIDVREIQNQARNAEQARVREILAIGERFNARELASEAVNGGTALDAFRAQVLERVGTQKPLTPPSADIGMSPKETQQFSIVRALNALVSGNWKGAELERDASHAVGEKMNRSPQGFFVPNEVLKRDLTVGTATAGGHTVATNLLAANFIDLLRNKMVVMKAGAQLLSGLVGSIAIPRQTGGASAFWVAESGAPTESQQAFDQVTMAPKTVGAFSDISRKLLLQSSMDIEAFVRNDLATILALEIDRVALHGSGTAPEPRGIFNVSGIGDVAGGTNGAAPTWANIIELETDVSVANADVGTLAYVTNSKVRGKLKGTEKASSTGMFVWADGATPLNGYAAHVSNQVRSDLTKGTGTSLSAIFFGNWADLIIGQWGALDIMVDPYTGSTSGTVRVVALQDVDVAVRHAESWSVMKDAITV